jgi:hypothetical protein
MDANQFDRLTRTFADPRSRRSVVKGILGGGAAMVAAALGIAPTDAAPKPKTCKVGCSGFNRQAKSACEKACKECGGNFDQVCTEDGPFGPTAFICCTEGTVCVFGAGICCNEGTEVCFGPDGATCCPDGTFCNFDTGECGPPAVCDATSGCLGGTCASGCFCVSSVEGDGACVSGEFANCDAPPCASSADCGGGVCVDATDCCGVPTVICFPPEGICQPGAMSPTSGRGTAPGWK